MNVLANSYVYLNRFVKREINYHKVKPTNMMLYLTYRCTSKCKSCNMWNRASAENELSLNEWKRCIDMVKDLGILNIEMFGGDALLRKDVLAPLSYYAKKRNVAQVDVTTNCNLLDKETSESLVDAGMNIVYISLDGVGELHDKVRGVEGSFERTKKGIEHMLKARMNNKRPEIILNCTVSSLNVNGFDKVLTFGEDIGADAMALEYVGQFPKESIGHSKAGSLNPEPYYVTQDESILLNREQAIYFKYRVKQMKQEAGSMRIRLNSRNVDILTVGNMVSGTFPNKRCYICRYLIMVDPFGNIIPCPFFNTYILGNIRQKHLGDIWNNEAHKNFIRMADEGKFEICKYCILGVERNPTLFQSVKKFYFGYVHKGYDE